MKLTPASYKCNVSLNGIPFYVQPVITKEQELRVLKQYNKMPGMYYLFDKGELVYVGISTTNCHSRIYDHLKDKEFDSWFLFEGLDLETGETCIDRICKSELEIIKRFKPKYNSLNARPVVIKN